MSPQKFKNTLLFLTRTFDELHKNARHLLEQSFELTQSNLFIYIAPKLELAAATTAMQTKTSPQIRLLINEFYANSIKLNPAINVVCLLNRMHSVPVRRGTKYPCDYDLVLVDLPSPPILTIRQHLISNFTKTNSTTFTDDELIRPLELLAFEDSTTTTKTLVVDDLKPLGDRDLIAAGRVYAHSILGGTFDRIHVGHKLLLTETMLLTTDRLLVGLADGPLLAKKKLADLIEKASEREAHLRALCAQMRPDLELIVTPIHDPYGPSIVERDYECIVVSEETRSGGEAVNVKRLERDLPALDVHVIGLAEEAAGGQLVEAGDEAKVSSSNERRRLLGKLIRPPRRPARPNQPYVIGLTGGLASGKSAILNDLARLGAGVIDCDKLGHQVYAQGTRGYERLIETFGRGIVNAANGEIDRKELGKLVFVPGGGGGGDDDKSGLKRLTDIVWPEVHRMVEERTRELFETRGHRVVVVEAPLLIEAGWLDSMNEIWVVFVPFEEALQRAMRRDGSDETKVRGTLNSQLSNKERIRHANVVFSSLWEREYTVKQVRRAWDSLLERINQQLEDH